MTQIYAFNSHKSQESAFAGTLYFTERRLNITSMFSLDAGYLANQDHFQFDPELPLELGNRPISNELPGSFLDASPDRWGRNLIQKRFPNRRLNAIDYLLGTSDLTRQGSLRFKIDPSGPFEFPETEVPKMISLPKLLDASRSVDIGENDPTAFKYLLDAGTASLGGARPKASIMKNDELYLAKFPHIHDEWDVIGDEYAALQRASKCGIEIPEIELIKIGSNSILLLKRFDRISNQRIGYISAMTLIGAKDWEKRDYLEIAAAIRTFGTSIERDLQQLFRRIAFTISVNNTDDHLRNIGFLRNGSGWHLSPAFDINPNPQSQSPRITSIAGQTSKDSSIKALIENSKSFGITPQSAKSILSEMGL